MNMQNIEEIYKEHFQTVYKYLFCLTRSPDISEDLSQETFCRAIKYINSFKGNCKISVWLCQIAKNLWLDELKKKKHLKAINEDELFTIPSIDNVEDNLIHNSEKKNLYENIKNLDNITQKIIYMRIVSNLSFKEIADIMNKTETWTRVTFYRGKQKLKEGINYDI